MESSYDWVLLQTTAAETNKYEAVLWRSVSLGVSSFAELLSKTVGRKLFLLQIEVSVPSHLIPVTDDSLG